MRNHSTTSEPSGVTTAQKLLSSHASTLGELAGQLRGIVRSIPASARELDMIEDRIPKDVPTEITGVLEYLLAEHLEPAQESLEKLARVTEEDLHQEFSRAQARYVTIETARPGERRRRILKIISGKA